MKVGHWQARSVCCCQEF